MEQLDKVWEEDEDVETCPRCERETIYGLVRDYDLPTDKAVCEDCRSEYFAIEDRVRDAYGEMIREDTDARWLDEGSL